MTMKVKFLGFILCVLIWVLFDTFRPSVGFTGKEHISIFGAVQVGDLQAVKDYVAGDDSLTTLRKNHGETILFHAIKCKQLHVVAYLTDLGLDVNDQIPRTGDTPLHYAVMVGDPKIVGGLLAHGADVNLRNVNGDSSIDFARDHSYPDASRILSQLLDHQE